MITNTTSYSGHIGNGATTSFPTGFKFYAEEHVTVFFIENDTVVPVDPGDYSVTGTGDESGGTVTFTTPPAVGIVIMLKRHVPKTQETDYVNNNVFEAESNEMQLDKIVMMIQEVANVAASDRNLRVPVSESVPPIPNKTDRADTILGFDLNGDPMVGDRGLLTSIEELEAAVLEAEVARDEAQAAQVGAETAQTAAETAQTAAEVAQAAAEDAAQIALGAGFLSGNGPPDNAIGSDGWHYLDDGSGVLYKKISGAWDTIYDPTNTNTHVVFSLPPDSFGANGDTAILVMRSGIRAVYLKVSGTWEIQGKNLMPGETGSFWLDFNPMATVHMSTQAEGDDIYAGSGFMFTQLIGSGRIYSDTKSNSGWAGSVTMRLEANDPAGAQQLYLDAPGGAEGLNINFIVANGFRITFCFKMEDPLSQFKMGFISKPNGTASPQRFMGIAADGTTDFRLQQIFNGSLVQDNSLGVPVDTAAHTCLIEYDKASEEWVFYLDGVERRIPRGDTYSYGHNFGILHMAANTTAAAHLGIYEMKLQSIPAKWQAYALPTI